MKLLDGTGGDEQQAADAPSGNNKEHATGHDDGTSQPSPSRAPSATQAATGDERKRPEDVDEPGDGIKRQMITQPLGGCPGVAPPSCKEQQVIIASEAQTPNTEPEMQLDATEGQKLLAALFSVVSMKRLLRERWEPYEHCRGKYRRRCDVVESFQSGLEEFEKKKHSTIVNPKHLSEIVEYRNQLSKFTTGLKALKEEKYMALSEYDALHDELDVGVEGVPMYDESLKDDEALQFLAKRGDFWQIFKARQERASAAAKNAEVRRKEIEDERAAIRSRMEGHFKQSLVDRLANPGATITSPWATVSTEEYVRRLSVLADQQKDLQSKDKFEDVDVLRSKSAKLLKIADQAFVAAKILRPA
ncbi:hypothetical protein Q7P35_004683 [Cladosporium inversicolor]